MTAVEMTVVVPTCNRPEALGRCLAALSLQAGPELEIVVVDDGSDDPDAARQVVDAHPDVRLVRQQNAGPAAARNLGVRASRGEFVGFTDDDCEPAQDWALRLRNALAGGADAVGGVTVSGWRGDPYVEATDEIITNLQWPDGRSYPPGFTPGNNLASRRRYLLDQPFDERFPVASGEDRDWCARLVGAGGKLVVDPDAVVYHFPATGVAAFWRQHVRYGRGAYRLARAKNPGRKLFPPSFYLRLVRRGFSRGFRCGALVVLAQLATAVGFAREARAAPELGR